MEKGKFYEDKNRIEPQAINYVKSSSIAEVTSIAMSAGRKFNYSPSDPNCCSCINRRNESEPLEVPKAKYLKINGKIAGRSGVVLFYDIKKRTEDNPKIGGNKVLDDTYLDLAEDYKNKFEKLDTPASKFLSFASSRLLEKNERIENPQDVENLKPDYNQITIIEKAYYRLCGYGCDTKQATSKSRKKVKKALEDLSYIWVHYDGRKPNRGGAYIISGYEIKNGLIKVTIGNDVAKLMLSKDKNEKGYMMTTPTAIFNLEENNNYITYKLAYYLVNIYSIDANIKRGTSGNLKMSSILNILNEDLPSLEKAKKTKGWRIMIYNPIIKALGSCYENGVLERFYLTDSNGQIVEGKDQDRTTEEIEMLKKGEEPNWINFQNFKLLYEIKDSPNTKIIKEKEE